MASYMCGSLDGLGNYRRVVVRSGGEKSCLTTNQAKAKVAGLAFRKAVEGERIRFETRQGSYGTLVTKATDSNGFVEEFEYEEVKR